MEKDHAQAGAVTYTTKSILSVVGDGVDSKREYQEDAKKQEHKNSVALEGEQIVRRRRTETREKRRKGKNEHRREIGVSVGAHIVLTSAGPATLAIPSCLHQTDQSSQATATRQRN